MGKNLEINSEIEKYIEELSYNLHPIQKEIIKYNDSLGDIKRMQISVSQCHFLHLFTKVSKIKNVLEIGTFTGLSTLSIALALPNDGSLIALDKNEATNKVAVDFFKKANQEIKINTIIKPALDSLAQLKKNNKIFDMVFIDADKENYKNYYDNSLDLITKDGLIIIDNVLWHGDVVDKTKSDKFTNIIRDFNSYVKNDKKTEQIILPLGDGFTVCRKL
jgi:predicted O-methyltransferase YrrM